MSNTNIHAAVIHGIFDDHDRANYDAYKRCKKNGNHLTPEQKAANAKFWKCYKRLQRTGSALKQMEMKFTLIRIKNCKIDHVYAQMMEEEVRASKSYRNKLYKGEEHLITDDEKKANALFNRLRARSDDHRECMRRWKRTPNGKAYMKHHKQNGNLEKVWNEFNGKCLYTGIPLMRGGRVADIHIADCDHIDSSLKGTPMDNESNWVLASSIINASKRDKCFYEWHQENIHRYNLRPMDCILADLKRLGKAIPKKM